MRRNTIDHQPRTERIRGIWTECERIRSGWSRTERERRADLAAVRQFALWESISQGPPVVAIDRRLAVNFK